MVEEILDVVIVGCGSAAIAAALKLNQSKVANKFIILEAGQEIGGRCRTKELDKGLAVDIGASWIHDHAEDNRLTQHAKQLSYDVQDKMWVDPKSYFYDPERRQMAQPELVQKALDAAKEVLSIDEEKARSYRSYWDAISQSCESQLARHAEDEDFKRAFWFFLSCKEKYENTTLESLAANHEFYYKKNIGLNGLPAGGYGTLLRKIAEPIRNRVRLNSQVQSIVSEDGSKNALVEVRGISGGTPFVYKTRHVIVTVSLGVLKAGTISFVPSLPAWKQSAIQHVGFGLMNKIIMEFEEKFWPNDAVILAFFSARRGHYSIFFDFAFKRPVLVCFLTGKVAREFEQKFTDEQILEGAILQLSTAFGDLPRKKLKRWHVTRWAQEPNFRGSYSFVSAETTSEDLLNLQKPVHGGRVRFAGEACHPQYIGSVHGAYATGEKEAEIIISGDLQQISAKL